MIKTPSWLRDAKFLFACRLVLGSIFLYASFGKILDPRSFAETILAYQIFSSPLIVRYVAVTLPWVEWFCGILLILGIFVRSAAALSTAMLTAFLVGMISAWVRGLNITCGCFGPTQETIGAITLLRDGVFLSLSLFILLSHVDSLTLQQFLLQRRVRST
ncbi:MAG: DoxX family protein [Acidobacteriota bacterium]